MKPEKINKSIFPIIMTFIVFIVIQFDAAALIIPNQIVAMNLKSVILRHELARLPM